jgi:hypothetical protein
MLNLIDEFTYECQAMRVDRRLNSADVIDVLGPDGGRPRYFVIRSSTA